MVPQRNHQSCRALDRAHLGVWQPHLRPSSHLAFAHSRPRRGGGEVLWRARAQPPPHVTTIPGRVGRSLWLLSGGDIVIVAWMISAGEWLDDASKFSALITLDGRHELVLGLALLGFAVLAVLGVWTDGFRGADRLQLALIAAGSGVSVFALAGVLLAGVLLAIVLLVTGGIVFALSALLLFRGR